MNFFSKPRVTFSVPFFPPSALTRLLTVPFISSNNSKLISPRGEPLPRVCSTWIAFIRTESSVVCCKITGGNSNEVVKSSIDITIARWFFPSNPSIANLNNAFFLWEIVVQGVRNEECWNFDRGKKRTFCFFQQLFKSIVKGLITHILQHRSSSFKFCDRESERKKKDKGDSSVRNRWEKKGFVFGRKLHRWHIPSVDLKFLAQRSVTEIDVPYDRWISPHSQDVS